MRSCCLLSEEKQLQSGRAEDGSGMLQMASRKTGLPSLVSDALDWLLVETKLKSKQVHCAPVRNGRIENHEE